MDRLFLPLYAEHFNNFKSRSKSYELRRYGKGFTEQFVYQGRIVELRKGYAGESIWGQVGRVTIGTLEEVLSNVHFTRILPSATSMTEAREKIRGLLGKKEKFIAFEIILRDI